MVLVAGIDEAGRGCVIGPLVIVAAGLDDRRISKFVEAGAKDSKKLTTRRRILIASRIRRVARFVEMRRISARRIDGLRNRGLSLNEIEAMLIGSIVRKHGRGTFYVDSVDRNCERFRMMILKYVPGFRGKLIVRNYLDESNPLVGAASVIAKVERDRAVRKLLKEAGLPECSGYPGDSKTPKLIEQLLRSNSGNGILRMSWSTVEIMKSSLKQDRLTRFL
ncbi:MAG: ribonuclease HII [Thermoproteota archaeon]